MRDCYSGKKLGAATVAKANPAITRGNEENANKQNSKTVRKINSVENRVILMRTSTVKVLNPVTGQSTRAYAQHDKASEATLIEDSLKDELGLKTIPDTSLTLHTPADQKVFCGGRTNSKLESLYCSEQFTINVTLIVPQFSDNVSTLPHAVGKSTLGHFDRVRIPVTPGRKRIDVLIGQSYKVLLTIGVAKGGGGQGSRAPPVKIPLTTKSYDNIAWRCLVAVFFQ